MSMAAARISRRDRVPEDPVAVVASLTEMVRSECADVDRTRALPMTVVSALREAGVFRSLAPREIGGAEVDPVTFLRIVEAASHADGSVGWCTMIGGAYSLFGGLLSAEGAREVYGDPTTISAGAFRPGGVARQVEGGLRVTGRWSLGSGSTHANWFVAGCSILRDDRPIVGPTGMPVIREVFVPAAEVTVVDTWESTGLRGTASHDYAVSDVFVPTSRTFWFQESPVCERALYRMPPVAMFATFIAAVPLGIARHALDAFASLAQTKTQDMSSVAMADRPVAQATLGRSHALVAAGRTYLIETLDDLWTRVQAGHAPGLVDRGALWLAATHAAHSALEAIDTLYSMAGASAVYERSPLDRCLRDARTAVQHVCTQKSNFELAGRRLLRSDDVPGTWGIDYRGER